MPKTNYTIDNITPGIIYSPSSNWIDGSQTDPERDRYWNNGTFKSTTKANATATFTFNGTSVWVYGSKRVNHGKYSVSLDGKSVGTSDGQTSLDSEQFQVPLYSAISLSLGSHEIALTNAPSSKDNNFLDIDFIAYETDIGTPEETPEISVVQDDQFTYNPLTSWSNTSDKLQGFNGSTGHLTDKNAAFVTYDFTGDAISVWGSIGPDNGLYSVSLDGGESKSFSANNANYFSQVRLYEANNLGPGKHSFVMTNQPQVSGQVMAVDYAIITNIAATKPAKRSHGLSGGTKAGIAVGVVAGVVAIFGLLWLLIRRRKTKVNPRTQTAQTPDRHETAPSAVSPLLAPAQMDNLTPNPLHSAAQPTPSKVVHLRYNDPTLSREGSNALRIPDSTTGEQVTSPVPRKLPQTPGQPETDSQGLEGRIREPGREIDAGPLPPSYVQATQPI